MRTLLRQSIHEVQVERRRPPKRYEVDLSKVHDLYCNTTHCYNLKKQRKAAPRLTGKVMVSASEGGEKAALPSGTQTDDDPAIGNLTNEMTEGRPPPPTPETDAVIEATILDVAAKEVLSSTFHQLHEDAATREFLRQARDPSHLRKAASHVLARVISRTAANGITGSGGMFVLSSEQFDALLEPVGGGPGTAPSIAPSASFSATDGNCKVPAAASSSRGGMGEDMRQTDSEVGGNAWVPLALRRYMANRSAASAVQLDGVMEVSDLSSVLIDIGAGDGGATSHLAGRFAHTWASEASRAMQIRLRRRGYRVVDFPSCCLSVAPNVVTTSSSRADQDDGTHLSADLRALLSTTPITTLRASPPCVLSCLNVLDRADVPMSLLRALHASLVAIDRFVAGRCLANSGDPPPKKAVCLLALVLPWCPFVEGWSGHKEPTEAMPMSGGRCNQGAPFEAAVFTFVRNVLIPLGFRVVRWSRVPYLCEGDNTTEYYALDDAVFVLESATP